MSISKREVENAAALARLCLTEDEKVLFSHQLSDILTHIDTLSNLPADDVDPLAGGVTPEAPLREDGERPPFSRGDLMSGAPEKGNGHFKVPRIIE